MASKKMSRMLKDDHDDAHFSDNPAVRKPKGKRTAKKRSGGRKSKR